MNMNDEKKIVGKFDGLGVRVVSSTDTNGIERYGTYLAVSRI